MKSSKDVQHELIRIQVGLAQEQRKIEMEQRSLSVGEIVLFSQLEGSINSLKWVLGLPASTSLEINQNGNLY